MEQQIWKFPLAVQDRRLIDAPRGAKALTVQMQGETPCLWAIVDPGAEVGQMTVQTVGTGQPIREPLGKHAGTYQMKNAGLVFHVFVS